jgi:hypothetical protein
MLQAPWPAIGGCGGIVQVELQCGPFRVVSLMSSEAVRDRVAPDDEAGRHGDGVIYAGVALQEVEKDLCGRAPCEFVRRQGRQRILTYVKLQVSTGPTVDRKA